MFNVTLYTSQKTYDDSFIQPSLLFLSNYFHLILSLDLTFDVCIAYLLFTFTFCAVLIILNLQFVYYKCVIVIITALESSYSRPGVVVPDSADPRFG